jgi:hypothetical protein
MEQGGEYILFSNAPENPTLNWVANLHLGVLLLLSKNLVHNFSYDIG